MGVLPRGQSKPADRTHFAVKIRRLDHVPFLVKERHVEAGSVPIEVEARKVIFLEETERSVVHFDPDGGDRKRISLADRFRIVNIGVRVAYSEGEGPIEGRGRYGVGLELLGGRSSFKIDLGD